MIHLLVSDEDISKKDRLYHIKAEINDKKFKKSFSHNGQEGTG